MVLSPQHSWGIYNVLKFVYNKFDGNKLKIKIDIVG